MAHADWTDERERALRRWWKNGKSAREIADILGMSRNAVIGKAQRLGLSGPPTPTTRSGRLAAAGAGKRKAARVDAARSALLAGSTGNGRAVVAPPAAPRAPLVRLAPSGPVTMAQLTETMCRYPFGDRPRDLTFCADPIRPGSTYCDHHHARCWQSPVTRQADRPAAGPTRGGLIWLPR